MNSSKTLPSRIYFLDVAKVLCAFLVVYAHLFSKDSLTRLYIYSFHMPLFFIISGIFHKYSGLNQTKNIRRIIIPTIFFCLFVSIIRPIFSFLLDSSQLYNIGLTIKTNLYNDFISIYYSNGKLTNTPCWFLFALFWCKIFTDIIIVTYNKYINLLSNNRWFQILMLMPFIPLSIVHFPLYMKQACMAIPFYFIGYFFSMQLKTLDYAKTKFYYIPVLLFINILISTFNGRVSMLGISYGHVNILGISYGLADYFFRIPLFYINGFVGTLMVIYLSLFIKKHKNFFSSISNSLLTIVGMQSFIYYYYVKLTHYSFDFFIPFTTSIVIMVLCYGFHLLLERYFPWILGKNTQKSI